MDSYEGPRTLEGLKNYVQVKIAEHSLLSTVSTDKSKSAEKVPPSEPLEEDMVKKSALSCSRILHVSHSACVWPTALKLGSVTKFDILVGAHLFG